MNFYRTLMNVLHKKTLEVSGSHSLSLPYSSKCTNMHGHNWILTSLSFSSSPTR